jgi:beta-galactosidase
LIERDTLRTHLTEEIMSAILSSPSNQTDTEPRVASSPARWMPGVNHIAFGGDYNPEQWPREVWQEDVRLMQEAGVNLVSIGIFSWALLEPREGEFEFGWLDDVIELLSSAGIGISLGTPTASPPAWFWTKYPQARPVNRDGIPLGFGSRGMASPSSPDYARAVTRITRELGQRYGRHAAVKIWHVHNEYGAPISESYSDDSVAAVREWLLARYGSLDGLNAAWGTAFWGQRYGEWNEVDAPRLAASVVNPAQRLDFARFTSDALLACFTLERDILHELSPGIPVTTNFMATNCPSMDYWKWAREVDIVSNDHYLAAEREDAHIMLSMDADLTRSLAGGKPWILMEHSTSAVSWQGRNIAKLSGELARNSMAHFARGADGILFFQWRASRFGAEKFHSGMLPHSGPDSRIFRETTALGERLAGLSSALGSVVDARVAILWDWESFWAQDLEWRPTSDLSHRRQVENFYTRLWLDGITTDFVHPEADLCSYHLVLAPASYLVSEAGAANIRTYVGGGGVFVSSYFSGIVDSQDAVFDGAVPGALRDVLGLRVEEFRPLRVNQQVELSNGLTGRIWTDEIVTTSAAVVASYLDGPATGGAAITRNEFGDGSAWYLSTEFDAETLAGALAGAFADAGIAPDPLHDPELETVVRSNGVDTFTTYINHGARDLVIDEAGFDPQGDAQLERITVTAGSVLVIRRPHERNAS